MAEIPVSDEEMALRRRARRRLVGAVALALSAIVILPMLFDPEPKPLGPDIDVQIPAQDSPFKPSQPPAAPAVPAATAEPATRMLNPVETTPPSQATPAPVARPAEPTQPAAGKAAESVKPAAASKEADKPLAKNLEAATSKPAGKGYSLQLGLFEKKANADKLVERARSAGFKAQVSELQGRWRVQVGPVAERAKADDLQAKLKAKGLDAVLIAP
jgi:DedD protein